MTTTEFFERVRERVPAFGPAIDDHISYNDEILPHLLIAELGQFIESFFTRTQAIRPEIASETEVKLALSVIDDGLREGDEDTINMIAVSFVEHLWCEPHYESLRSLLGPGVRAEIERQIEW